MKLQDIDNELCDQTPREVHFKEVPLEFIHEISRLYDAEVYTGTDNKWLQIKQGKVEITLNTSKH